MCIPLNVNPSAYMWHIWVNKENRLRWPEIKACVYYIVTLGMSFPSLGLSVSICKSAYFTGLIFEHKSHTLKSSLQTV